ncbi:protein of unknown function (DUF4095) [Photorhabdus aegyptia]|uniref:Uncharacterized protein n=2 Tax=Morganellaceae TaxID=1903414 RepID=A0A022PGN7_9GAMM|nr:protein of unknown function (DUF4095) [Photorhabdus aegyptia]
MLSEEGGIRFNSFLHTSPGNGVFMYTNNCYDKYLYTKHPFKGFYSRDNEMDMLTAINKLDEFSKMGRAVFLLQDLEVIFADETSRTLQKSIDRLIKAGLLLRITKGVYVYTRASMGSYPLETIAKNIRRGEYNYISLESALSQYGFISQIPIDRLTIMSTGRAGEFKTPWGVIEITHTSREPSEILKATLESRGPLRIAKKETALRDQKRVGRNMHLVQLEELNYV